MSAECFQAQRHFCLIFIPFFDQNQHLPPSPLVLCTEQSVNNITRGLGGQDAVAGQKRGTKMAMVKASLTLFGGDTLVVRCSERCHIHLMSAKVPGDSHADILSVQDRDSAYLTVPYSGTWNVLIDSHSQSLEHSISYVPA